MPDDEGADLIPRKETISVAMHLSNDTVVSVREMETYFEVSIGAGIHGVVFFATPEIFRKVVGELLPHSLRQPRSKDGVMNLMREVASRTRSDPPDLAAVLEALRSSE